jgi:hypothetical protein
MKKKIVMADRSFEQRVQEELGSLKMRPDEGVWAKVEAGLNKEKKRRWLIWLFLFAALTGASFWGYMRFGETGGQAVRSEEIGKQGTGKEETGKEETGKQETGKQEAGKQETGKQEAGKQETVRQDVTKQEISEPKTGTQELETLAGKDELVKQQRTNPVTARKEIVKQDVQEINNPAGSGKNKKVEKAPQGLAASEKHKEEPAAKKTVAVTEENKNKQTFTNVSPTEQVAAKKEAGHAGTDVTVNETGKEKQASSTVAAPIVKKETDQKESAAIITSGEEKTGIKNVQQPELDKNSITASPNDTGTVVKTISPKKLTKKKWQFSLVADAGRSALGNSLFSFLAINPAYRNDPSNSVGTPGSPSVPNTPPSTTNALGFGLQFQASRVLDKTFSIGIFGGYALLQTRTTIGKRVDSLNYSSAFNSYNSNGFYYTNADSASYTNRYHYVSIGSELHTSFTLFKTINARWQLGGGLNFLLGSNGLHYDNTSGRSFQNNGLLTHVLPYFSSGIDFAIGKRPFMYAGPHLQYNAGHLNKQSASGDHLFFTSLRLSFLLSRNKK